MPLYNNTYEYLCYNTYCVDNLIQLKPWEVRDIADIIISENQTQ